MINFLLFTNIQICTKSTNLLWRLGLDIYTSIAFTFVSRLCLWESSLWLYSKQHSKMLRHRRKISVEIVDGRRYPVWWRFGKNTWMRWTAKFGPAYGMSAVSLLLSLRRRRGMLTVVASPESNTTEAGSWTDFTLTERSFRNLVFFFELFLWWMLSLFGEMRSLCVTCVPNVIFTL